MTSRTEDVCHQLMRYGDEVFSDDLADLLEVIVEINDDQWHARSHEFTQANVEKAKAILDKIAGDVS